MNKKPPKWHLTTIRLPIDVKDFLKQEAYNNCSTQTAEIVKAVREQMKEKGAVEAATSPRHVQESQPASGDCNNEQSEL